MNQSEIVRSLFTAIEKQDKSSASSLLSNDFIFGGATPMPVNGDTWLGVHGALSKAMPDFSFNMANLEEAGNQVKFTVQITGTHNGPLALPFPGFSPVPASGRKVVNAKEHVTATLANGKVTHVDVEHLENGGLPELVRQMGGKLG